MEAPTDTTAESMSAPRPKRAYQRRKPMTRKTRPVDDEPQAQPVERPPLREAQRDEDPRAAAMRRAQEWFKHIDSLPDGTDRFYIDPHKIPDGWTYEWKRWATVGKEDPQYQVSLQQTAWSPVPAKRHPELMPTGFGGATIDIDGMRLMERPEMITNYQKERDRRAAEAPLKGLKSKLATAPPGQFERDNPGGAPPIKLSTRFEPPAIPKE